VWFYQSRLVISVSINRPRSINKKKSESATERRISNEPRTNRERRNGLFLSKKGRYPMVKRGRRTRS
jgi:hypothetical protein